MYFKDQKVLESGDHMELKLKIFLKFKTEAYQGIELKEYMRGVIRLVMFTPIVMVIKMSKMVHFTAKNQSQFG